MSKSTKYLAIVALLLTATQTQALVLVDQVSDALVIPPSSGIVATTSDFSRPFQIADGFEVSFGRQVRVTRADWVGRSRLQTLHAGGTVLDFTIRIFRFEDAAVQAVPFAEVDVSAQVLETPTSHPSLVLYSAAISPPITLPDDGTYFFSVVADTPDTTEDWWWFFLDGSTMSYHRNVDGEAWIERLPRSYSFRLHGELAPDAATMLGQLQAAVSGVGPGKSLADKVSLAQTYYGVPDVQATCAVLTAFSNEVRAQRGKKMTVEVADDLTAEAQAIMGAIGCE